MLRAQRELFKHDMNADEYGELLRGIMIDHLKRDAVTEGKPFNLNDPATEERIELAVVEALDDMGYLGPPE